MAFQSEQTLNTSAEIDAWFADNETGIATIKHETIYRGKVTATYNGLKVQKKNGRSNILYVYRSPLDKKERRMKLGEWRVNGFDLKAAQQRHKDLSQLVAAGRCPVAEQREQRAELTSEAAARRAERASAAARKTQTFDEYFFHWVNRQRAEFERSKGTEEKRGFGKVRENSYRTWWRKWGAPLHRLHVGLLNDKFIRFYVKCMNGAPIDASDWICHPGTNRKDLAALPFLDVIKLVDHNGTYKAEPFALLPSGRPHGKYAGRDVCANIVTIFRGIGEEIAKRAELDVSTNPVVKPDLDFLITPKRKKRPFQPAELVQIFQYMRAHEDDDVYNLIGQLVMLTGCRKSEIIQARRSWFAVKPGWMVIPETKNGKPHAVKITPMMAHALRKATKTASIADDRIFPLTTGNVFWARLQAMAEALDVPPFHPHAFRSAFATVAINFCDASETYVDACLNHTLKDVSDVGRKSYDVAAAPAKMAKIWDAVSDWYDRHAIQEQPIIFDEDQVAEDLSFLFS